MRYTSKKILSLYGASIAPATLKAAESAGTIPLGKRVEHGKVRVRHWSASDLPLIGERWGFLRHLPRSAVACVFATKGGVLKTTLALNLARMAALHNVRTCVVGLDIQGDITTALGLGPKVDDSEDIQSALARLPTTRGLFDLFEGRCSLQDVIAKTDIPVLDIIPETPDLAVLDSDLNRSLRKEYWLRDTVIKPLRENYELILIDCSPNWNSLVTNALTSCDILLSPLECRIVNFRNFEMFRRLTNRFREIMQLNYEEVFIPTRLNVTRKLSSSIRAWYMVNVPGCTSTALRDSNVSEEAMGVFQSLPEFQPRTLLADEMRELIREIWERIQTTVGRHVNGAVA